MKTAKINTLRAAIESTQGRFFTVTFKKKDGSMRTMNARTDVKKHLKGGSSTTAHIINYMTVYDVVARSYKNINLDTVTELRYANEVLTFKEAV